MRAMLRKYQNVFRSRWKAVMWSMGVLLTAYCSVPSADSAGENGAGEGSAGEDEQLAAIAEAIAAQTGEQVGPAAEPGEHHHTNPWALPAKQQH